VLDPFATADTLHGPLASGWQYSGPQAMASRDTTFRLRNRLQYVSSGRLVLRDIIRRASEGGVRLIDCGESNTLYKCELANGLMSGMVVTVAARAPGLFRCA